MELKTPVIVTITFISIESHFLCFVFVFVFFFNVELRLYYLVILICGRVIKWILPEKKKQQHIIMSKKFDMIQRTMGVLRFPGHITFISVF